MSSRPRSLLKRLRTCRMKRRSLPGRSKTSLCRNQRRFSNVRDDRRVELGVSAKLEALKNLIPAKNGDMKADRLFEETADYIVFLKAQVDILQRLIDFYGSDDQKKKVV
ncbi:hypothetical protein NE237_019862 [Protea cynaroides]|uniref:Uncharacterized protein n=1 Tax=Protea cynaroides TaxID=273540 RepID=A0A9Q0H9G8_9MAGN|nr:hypothetical protein NE237_019862 [Protea cynaroides]